MRVLVTGHRGYIGSVLVPRLIGAGHEVRGLDSGLFDGCDLGPGPNPVPALREDVRDVRDVGVRHLRDVEAIVHLAALSDESSGGPDPDLTDEINHRASVELAHRAREAGVRRFVFVSSCSSYGPAGDELLDEGTPLRPDTSYGLSNAAVEREVARLSGPGFSPTFLRTGTVYGISPRFRLDLVLNDLVASASTTGTMQLPGDGSAWRAFVHVEDVARAVVAALAARRDSIGGLTFNVGRTRENYRLRDVAEIVRCVVPGSDVTHADARGESLACRRLDCGRVRKALPDFRPIWTVTAGARELYQAFVSHGLTEDARDSGRYRRLEYLGRLMRDGRVDGSLRWRAGSPAQGNENGRRRAGLARLVPFRLARSSGNPSST